MRNRPLSGKCIKIENILPTCRQTYSLSCFEFGETTFGRKICFFLLFFLLLIIYWSDWIIDGQAHVQKMTKWQKKRKKIKNCWQLFILFYWIVYSYVNSIHNILSFYYTVYRLTIVFVLLSNRMNFNRYRNRCLFLSMNSMDVDFRHPNHKWRLHQNHWPLKMLDYLWWRSVLYHSSK